jgi:hypothetical protein
VRGVRLFTGEWSHGTQGSSKVLHLIDEGFRCEHVSVPRIRLSITGLSDTIH